MNICLSKKLLFHWANQSVLHTKCIGPFRFQGWDLSQVKYFVLYRYSACIGASCTPSKVVQYKETLCKPVIQLVRTVEELFFPFQNWLPKIILRLLFDKPWTPWWTFWLHYMIVFIVCLRRNFVLTVDHCSHYVLEFRNQDRMDISVLSTVDNQTLRRYVAFESGLALAFTSVIERRRTQLSIFSTMADNWIISKEILETWTTVVYIISAMRWIPSAMCCRQHLSFWASGKGIEKVQLPH